METKWSRMHPREHYKTLYRGGELFGWVIKINDKWVARKLDGSIRADFDTMKEAQDFLTLMTNVGEGDEAPV